MSKRSKRLVFYLAPVLVIVGLGLLAAKLQANRLSAQAQHLANTGQAAIRMLNDYAAGIAAFDAAQILSLYDDAYTSEHAGFWSQHLQSERDGVRVYTWQLEKSQSFTKAEQAEQISRYLTTMQSVEEVKFRLDGVEAFIHADAPVIRSVLWIIGTNTTQDVFESQIHFRMWLTRTDAGFRIHKQELLSGQTVIGNQNGFADVTAASGLDFVAQQNPLFDTPEWEPKKFAIARYSSAGVTAADYDNDGWYDVFFADGARARLYRNNGDGTFTDATAAAGLPAELPGINTGVFADFDNDGDKELFLGAAFTSNSYLFRNNGDGTFSDVSAGAGLGGPVVMLAAAGDYDNDGLLDLYIGRYLDPRINLPTTLFYTRNSEGNSLLRNTGNLRFSDVTDEAGVRDGGLTLGLAWADYDQDGDQDLYVTNDFGRNALYSNNGDGTFTDVAEETGTLDFGLGMSATWGDIDNDGDLDIYTSNVHTAQRWYAQAITFYQYLITSLWQGTLLEDLPLYWEIYGFLGPEWNTFVDRMGKGNSLLLNNGQGRFTDVSEATGTNPFGWYWASTMFDYDNDGRQDIYAVNGWISAESKEDL